MNAAIFASGSGTNAENLIKYFSERDDLNIVLLISNKQDAGVLERTKRLGVKGIYVSNKSIRENEGFLDRLQEARVEVILLAGFLQLIPAYLIAAFRGRILNIHPALLPKYGGKGMYGMHVHEAVIAARDKETGISIHEVNEHYDEGRIIFQAKCPVLESDRAYDVANRIHALEYEHFPEVVARWIKELSE